MDYWSHRALRPATRNAEAVARFERHLAAMRREAAGAARALAEIERCGHYYLEGCADIGQFGERHGASASEARSLVDMAKAFESFATVEDNVLSGRTSFQSAATLGRLAAKAAEYEAAGFDLAYWEEKARREPARVLARHADEWLETQRIGARPTAITAYLSPRGAEDYRKAREIASRKAGKALTDGATVERLAGHYLDSFDLTRKVPRRRRLPDTAANPFDRYVAAETRRAIASRSRGCAVPRCPNRIFLEMSHRVAHADGGSREAHNLDDVCSEHHVLIEQGLVTVGGTPEDPEFFDANGRLVGTTSEWGEQVVERPEFDEADEAELNRLYPPDSPRDREPGDAPPT